MKFCDIFKETTSFKPFQDANLTPPPQIVRNLSLLQIADRKRLIKVRSQGMFVNEILEVSLEDCEA